ncbi:MAG: hypothetical protein QOG79_4029 [Mycobacterium sp.]|jgi:signal transduction histidine kinase|nr:hypothetical protein [Mycobacterium sp.]
MTGPGPCSTSSTRWPPRPLPSCSVNSSRTRRDLSQRLEEIEEGKEHERALHAQAVLAGERTQLAREMYDVVSHQVSLIAVQAGALQVSAKEAASRAAARSIRALSVGTLDELRTMVRLLRA